MPGLWLVFRSHPRRPDDVPDRSSNDSTFIAQG